MPIKTLPPETLILIQRRLVALGFNLGASGPSKNGVDGEWGPVTEEALLKQLNISVPATAPAALGFGALPDAYLWLNQVDQVPRMVVEGLKLLGTKEVVGNGNSPIIMAWALETGVKGYSGDAVPWCGLFMAVVALRAGRKPVEGPLWALNWGGFGVAVDQPGLGDVLTFLRDGGGHVGIYIGEDRGTAANNGEDAAYHVLGGNQGDQVSIIRVLKKRMKAARRPAYTQQPLGVKPYLLKPKGTPSTNEA